VGTPPPLGGYGGPTGRMGGRTDLFRGSSTRAYFLGLRDPPSLTLPHKGGTRAGLRRSVNQIVDGEDAKTGSARRTLVIACGALAREIVYLQRGPLGHIDVTCLPAELHNRPERIPGEMKRKIAENRDKYDEILCLYGDCGTGGELDRVLESEGIKRIAGAHCYEFFAGSQDFSAMMEEEIGTFFLTDFLVRHFDRLVIKGLGLDRFPQLQGDYFGHYRRLVYLAQFDDPELTEKAKAAAERLGLSFERRLTGLGGMAQFFADHAAAS
jgi:hypothetical protein